MARVERRWGRRISRSNEFGYANHEVIPTPVILVSLGKSNPTGSQIDAPQGRLRGLGMLAKEKGTMTETRNTSITDRPTGPWDTALSKLREWDPTWAEACEKMTTNPWTNGVLPPRTIELIGVALNAACTNLNPDGTRIHIRAALVAGATRDEILMILKMASVMSIHSCSLAAPILLEEAKAVGVHAAQHLKPPVATPACEKMKAAGQWNQAWEPFYQLDPEWTEQFMATGIPIYASGLMTPKLIELLSIAFDASYTHLYAPGTRRHIKAALEAGATLEEIMEVLKLCVVQGVQACNLGVPILAEELELNVSGRMIA
jgi:alkylhydroperoxidase/carboxymuconolactone decarboxylase family protein YurZ